MRITKLLTAMVGILALLYSALISLAMTVALSVTLAQLSFFNK